MTLSESVRYCLTNYVRGAGRASRSEYWWFMLACTLAELVTALVDAFNWSHLISTLVWLATIAPTIAAATRRLHDTDRSGWWQLIAFIPFIGVIVLIVWLASEGTRGSNRFGPEPPEARAFA